MVDSSNPDVDYSDTAIFIVMDYFYPKVDYSNMEIFIAMDFSNQNWIIPVW